jgi:hypothetical protein
LARIKYLIKLDEQYLINFDEILNHYRRGREFIEYDSLNKETDVNNFALNTPKNRAVKTQVILYNVFYFVFAFIGLAPFYSHHGLIIFYLVKVLHLYL